MKRIRLVVIPLLLLLAACATSSEGLMTPEELAGRSFAFKTFDVEINRKLNIVSYDCLDTSHTLDVLPIREIKAWAEKEYGVSIDISEYERLHSAGKLGAKIVKHEGKLGLVMASDEMAVDGTSVGGLAAFGLLGVALSGTSWAALNWSEYREPVKTMDFRYKLERGKNDQMQVFVCLAPIGSYIAVILRVREGEPDAKGYYTLRVAAEKRVKVDFGQEGTDTEILERTIRNLPALLAGE